MKVEVNVKGDEMGGVVEHCNIMDTTPEGTQYSEEKESKP
jgi:hypothetical protein